MSHKVILAGNSQRLHAPSREKYCILCCSIFQKPPTDSWDYFLNRRMFCSSDCKSKAHQIAAALKRKPMEVVFGKWFEQSDGCWEWKGARDRDGYGMFSYAGKTMKAHRVSLQLQGTDIPSGYYACHKCNNPSCVNPDHLYVGTPSQNSRDKIAAGTHNFGEKAPPAKMTEEQVRQILRGGLSDQKFAEKFGVSSGAVHSARNRKTWKHVRV